MSRTGRGAASPVGPLGYRLVVAAGSAAAAVATAHCACNLRRLRAPPPSSPSPPPSSPSPPPSSPSPSSPLHVTEPVSVLVPVRNEAHQVEPCLRALLGSTGVPRLEILVLDDGSTDRTAEVVRRTAGADARVRLLTGRELPPGWLGKPFACAQLAAAATGAVLVFADADVVVAPDGLARAVSLLRGARLDLVSPYPRQLAVSVAERLVQPLLQWSWLTFLPLGAAERSTRPSMAAANGQLLVVDASAYRRAGGHRAVRSAVLEDLALARRIRQAGGRGGMADGTELATCRMYAGWLELRAGYTKSLWAAFGSPAGAAAAIGVLALLYVVPPLAALAGSRTGLAGYAAAVLGRALAARRTGGRVFPDALGHPASIALLGWLTTASVVGRRRGTLTWKDRPIR